MPLERKDQFQVSGLIAVIQEAVVTNLLEPGRQYMHQVTPDEFCMLQSNLTSGFTGLFPSGRKSDRILGNRKAPAVRNGNLVGITPKIFNGIAKAVKGFLDVGAPVRFIEAAFPFLPMVRVTQLFTGKRKRK